MQVGDAQTALRHLLNQWDPIGVADEVDDEYDCLIPPLFSRLSGGAGRTEVSEFLGHQLEDHFGLDPTHYDLGTVADRLLAWWATEMA